MPDTEGSSDCELQSPLSSPQPAARAVRSLSLPSLLAQSRLGRGLMVVRSQEVRSFLSLLESQHICRMLARDRCHTMADRFLLATVFVYFKRAELEEEEYTERNFWLALYLAHDQEEDDDKTKWELLPWALGTRWQPLYHTLMTEKLELWRGMGMRSLVSKRQCDQVMALSASAAAWARTRTAGHGGVLRRSSEEQYVPRGPDQPGCGRCPEVLQMDTVGEPVVVITISDADTEEEEEISIFASD